METLSKSTLQKTQELLENEYVAQEEVVISKIKEIHKFNLDGKFFVDSCGYSWRKENHVEVKFKHITESDLYFKINSCDEYCTDFSWHSTSAYDMSKEESSENLDKALNYITAVRDMLDLQNNHFNKIMEVVEDTRNFFYSEVYPERKKLNKISKEIDEVKKAISTIQKETKLKRAKELICQDGKEFSLTISYYYTARKCTTYLKIEKTKKGKFVAYTYSVKEYADKFNLTDEQILNLYKTLVEPITREDWAYDEENNSMYDDKGNHVYRYYLNTNYPISQENTEEYVEITKEEFKLLQR